MTEDEEAEEAEEKGFEEKNAVRATVSDTLN